MNAVELAKMIDFACLKPNITAKGINEFCKKAVSCNVGAVCVYPSDLQFVKSILSQIWQRDGIAVGAVAGFPFGKQSICTKEMEVRCLVIAGAEEIDVVMNFSRLIEGSADYIKRELSILRKAVPSTCVLKVILETCYLSDSQIIQACEIARNLGIDFVKTSTGFGPAGATVEHVCLMREAVGPNMGVKASGGIKTYKDALALIYAGADRLGCSGIEKILAEAPQ